MIPSLLAQGSFWLEPSASTGAETHDLVFYILLYTMAFFFFLVIGIMLLLVIIYRRRKGQHPEEGPTHNTPLEVSWTIIPLIIVTVFFVIGLKYFVDIESPPAGADVVDVEASQWQFNFKYPNGAESNELYLQVDRPVVLRLTSKDVSHALYIPAFRIQRNAVPGQNTEIWFKPTLIPENDPVTGEEGFYHVFCTQYCGLNHSEMHAKAFVLNRADYEKKLVAAANIFVDKDTKQPLPYAEVGKILYTRNCAQCHTIDGNKGTGPTWKGLYKSNVEFTASNVPGFSLSPSDDDKKWDDYFRESILHPEAKIVQGFQNVMPSQESNFSGSPYKEKELQAVIEFIKSNGDPQYYKPMKTPPPDSGNTPGGAKQTPSPGIQTSDKGQLPDKGQQPDKEPVKANPPAAFTANPQTGGNPEAADRPSDLPVDKSAAPSPAAKKGDGK